MANIAKILICWNLWSKLSDKKLQIKAVSHWNEQYIYDGHSSWKIGLEFKKDELNEI